MAEQASLILHQGIIHQIHHKADGCTLILNDEQTFYVPKALEKHLFKKDHPIDVIYDQNTQQVYALFNHHTHTLYLHPHIQNYDPSYLKRPFFKILFASVSFYLFILLLMSAWQVIVNGDIFYADLFDVIHAFHLPILVLATIYFVTRFKDLHQEKVTQVYDLLQFPMLNKHHLKRLRAGNSYFEAYPCLFDVRKIIELLQHYSIDEVQTQLQTDLQNIDSFHLSAWQREYFALQKISGVLHQIKKQQVPHSEVDTDPYIEIQAVVNGTPIYGYVDEFHLNNKAKVDVIVSTLRDEKGHYYWYLHDQQRYVYLDEDQPLLVDDWKTHLQAYGAVMMIMALFALFDGWASFMVVFLLGMVFLTLIFLIFYLYGKCFDDSEKYDAWVAQYITQHMNLKGIVYLDDLLLYRIFNTRKGRESRTGYDLMNKRH